MRHRVWCCARYRQAGGDCSCRDRPGYAHPRRVRLNPQAQLACCTIGGGTGQGSQTPPSHLAADPPHQRRCASLRDALIAILSQTAGYAGAAPTHIQSRHPMRRWARPGGLTRDRLPRAPHRPRRPMVTRYAIIGLGRKASRSVLLPLLLPAALRVQQTAHHITNMVRFVKGKYRFSPHPSPHRARHSPPPAAAAPAAPE